jgi:hypothetical protein
VQCFAHITSENALTHCGYSTGGVHLPGVSRYSAAQAPVEWFATSHIYGLQVASLPLLPCHVTWLLQDKKIPRLCIPSDEGLAWKPAILQLHRTHVSYWSDPICDKPVSVVVFVRAIKHHGVRANCDGG